MTMPFVVGGKGLFNRLKVGDKVAFELRLEDGKAVIVNVK
jgi:Cu/Ag efflux protein CusF